MIERIADLPFERRAPLELLGIRRGRPEPDLEFAGFGWGRLPRLELAGRTVPSIQLVEPLVLALHTPDVHDPAATELELEFELELGSETVSLVVPLARFLEQRVPRLPGDARDIVLALCNPTGMPVRAPSWLEDRRLHWASGDVIAWLDVDDGDERIRLQAERWHTIRGRSPEDEP